MAQVQQTLFEAKADFPLVYGRWAAHTNNFVYVFSGDIAYHRIQQISKFLLAPFTEGILAPVGGWSHLLLNNVPTSNNIGEIHTQMELEEALRLNPILSKVQFVMPPRWLLCPEDIIRNSYAAVTFSIHDPDVTVLPPFFHFSHSRDFTCP